MYIDFLKINIQVYHNNNNAKIPEFADSGWAKNIHETIRNV